MSAVVHRMIRLCTKRLKICNIRQIEEHHQHLTVYGHRTYHCRIHNALSICFRDISIENITTHDSR